MAKLVDTDRLTGAHTIIGVFASSTAARAAVGVLEREGMPADRVGIVSQNIRQAREPMGSYSPQGALAGAVVGVALILVYVLFGGEQLRSSPFSIVIGGFAIVVGLAFIGWLAGRGRVFKEDEYEDLEDDVASGETLVSVVCETVEGADETRAVLERSGAREVRVEDSAESV